MKTEYDFLKELLITRSYNSSCRSINLEDLSKLMVEASEKYKEYLEDYKYKTL